MASNSTPMKTHILREAQDGPYLVAPEHLREQLLQAKSRLQTVTPNRVLALHFTWGDPHSREYLYPGSLALAAMFEEYGYTTEHLPFSCHWTPAEYQRVHEMTAQPFVGPGSNWDRYAMIIIHYRGKTEYRDADETYDRPHVLLRPSTEGYNGQVNFTKLYHTLQNECSAQVVYLMDCDYPFRLLTDTSLCRDIPQFGCDPILAATSGRPDYDTSSCRQCFNNALIRHLKNALRDEKYHSLSTLFCATHQSKHNLAGEDLALVPMVLPTLSLGTVLVKVRISRIKRAADGSAPASQIVPNLQQWFAEQFQWSGSYTSNNGKLAEVVDSGSNDGFVHLRLSRALWHCFMPYRGWIELVDGVDQPEGILPYYGIRLREYPDCLTRPITPKDSPEPTPSFEFDSHMKFWYDDDAPDTDYSSDMGYGLFD